MNIQFEKANIEDLPVIIEMLHDDALGAQRESEKLDIKKYENAFRHIEKDPNNEIIVARDANKVIGVLQLTYLPSLTYQGSWRAQIEGVRIHQSQRGKGIGEHLFQWAIERAKQKGCKIVQLTSDKQRTDALRFYEKLGFKASHEGFKLHF